MSEHLLELEHVGHSFGGIAVLADVDLRIPHTGISGLIGPSGSGKSALLDIISGALVPDRGRLIHRGCDLGTHSAKARRRAGIVRTAETSRAFERLTVGECIMASIRKAAPAGLFCRLFASASRADAAATCAQADETCRRFDLGAVSGKIVARLNAMQRRLLELARAYEARPDLLLLDEPSRGLAPREVEILGDKLRFLEQQGTVVLLASHDMALMRIAATVHVLARGRIVASGPLCRIRADRDVRSLYPAVSGCVSRATSPLPDAPVRSPAAWSRAPAHAGVPS